MSLALSAADWLALFTHFLTLSLLAVGGAITAAPDMHRYLVDTRHWLAEALSFSQANHSFNRLRLDSCRVSP